MWYKVPVDLNSSQNNTHDLHIVMHHSIVILCWELLKWLANHRKLRHSSNTKCELPMQVSVGSSVLPKNCHRCTSPEWGHVTANTSVVHAAVQAPKIIFPEQLAISKKIKMTWSGKKLSLPSPTFLLHMVPLCFAVQSQGRQGGWMSQWLQKEITFWETSLPRSALGLPWSSGKSLRPYPSCSSEHHMVSFPLRKNRHCNS